MDLNLDPVVCDSKVHALLPYQDAFFFSSVSLWSTGQGCLLSGVCPLGNPYEVPSIFVRLAFSAFISGVCKHRHPYICAHIHKYTHKGHLIGESSSLHSGIFSGDILSLGSTLVFCCFDRGVRVATQG